MTLLQLKEIVNKIPEDYNEFEIKLSNTIFDPDGRRLDSDSYIIPDEDQNKDFELVGDALWFQIERERD